MRAESPLGRAVAATLATGALVGDQVMTDLVRARLQAADTSRGFILDGFPRTGAQARALDTMRSPDDLLVIHIAVADDAIVSRLSSRRVCDAWVDVARARLDRDFDRFDAFLHCRTPQDFIALSSELMRDNMETFLGYACKAGEQTVRIAVEARQQAASSRDRRVTRRAPMGRPRAR